MNHCPSNAVRSLITLTLYVFVLSACESPRRRERRKKAAPLPRRIEKQSQRPRPAPRPAPVQRMISGVVEVVTPSFVVVRGQRYPLAGAGVARDLEAEDKVLLTLRRGVVVFVQVFPKNPMQRSLVPPKPPSVGDLVSIDQVVGLVTKVENLKVTMKVKDGKRYIGQTTLKLTAKSSLRVIKAARKKVPKAVLAGDAPVAQSIPKSGLLSKILFVVDGKEREKTETELTLVAAKQSDREYAVTVIVRNLGSRVLRSYQLSLDFRSFGKNYDFGGLRISKSSESIPPGGRRRFSLRGEPLLGTPKQIRVMISQLEFD